MGGCCLGRIGNSVRFLDMQLPGGVGFLEPAGQQRLGPPHTYFCFWMGEMKTDTTPDAARPNGLYFHIGNSGFTFRVEDNGQGPELVVSGSVFGHRMLHTQMFTTASGLAALGSFLVEQSKREFSAPYCHVAEEPTSVMTARPALTSDAAK